MNNSGRDFIQRRRELSLGELGEHDRIVPGDAYDSALNANISRNTCVFRLNVCRRTLVIADRQFYNRARDLGITDIEFFGSADNMALAANYVPKRVTY